MSAAKAASAASPSELPPWLEAPWTTLRRAREVGRFPHALLLAGPAGVGKRTLLKALTEALLCPHPDARGFACGNCPDCRFLAAGTHPDLVRVEPEEDSKTGEIKVDAIRALAGAEGLTAHRGGWKLILIDPAHRMNVSAANALLKTLEEPAPSTLICLVSEQPSRLPATIRSRCQTLRLAVPPEAEALAWLGPRTPGFAAATLLHLAHGAPLSALAWADQERLALREKLFLSFIEVAQGRRDPLSEAAVWNQVDLVLIIDWLGAWLSDLLRLVPCLASSPAPGPASNLAVNSVTSSRRTPASSSAPDPEGAPQAARLINGDKACILSALAPRLDPAAAHRFLRQVWRAGASETANLNRLLLLESWLLEWAGLCRPENRPFPRS